MIEKNTVSNIIQKLLGLKWKFKDGCQESCDKTLNSAVGDLQQLDRDVRAILKSLPPWRKKKLERNGHV